MNGIETIMILGILVLLLLVLGRIMKIKTKSFHSYFDNIQIVYKGELKSLNEIIINEADKCLNKLGVKNLKKTRYTYLSLFRYISNLKLIKAMYHYKKLLDFCKGHIDVKEAAEHFEKLRSLCGSE